MGSDTTTRGPAISVAMATCDGEAYVKEQLDSITAQTLAPYEIVVCDDASSDDTMRIVQQFASRAAVPVRLHRNDERLGAAQNFARAISLCEGDLIALADQDDVWLPEKLARLSDAMAGGAAYAFCDATLVDERGAAIDGKTLLARRFPLATIAARFEAQREFGLMMKRDFIYGTTMMFRASLRDALLPIAEGWSHDTWIANALAALGYRGAAVLEPLVRYRQHGVQASGGFASPPKVPYEDRALALEELYAHVIAAGDRAGRRPDPRALAMIDEKLVYLRALVRMGFQARWRRPALALREVVSGRWGRYSPRTFG